MLAALERLGNQLPPRLKALLNLVITIALVLFSIPLLYQAASESDWSAGATGLGLLLLGVFNLFT